MQLIGWLGKGWGEVEGDDPLISHAQKNYWTSYWSSHCPNEECFDCVHDMPLWAWARCCSKTRSTCPHALCPKQKWCNWCSVVLVSTHELWKWCACNYHKNQLHHFQLRWCMQSESGVSHCHSPPSTRLGQCNYDLLNQSALKGRALLIIPIVLVFGTNIWK